jgi:hypothetical protein
VAFLKKLVIMAVAMTYPVRPLQLLFSQVSWNVIQVEASLSFSDL